MDENIKNESNPNNTPIINNTQNQNDYYAALKRIEDEKEAKKQEKKRKKRIGCGTALLIMVLISIVSSIGDKVEKQTMSSEPVTILNAKEVISYSKKNGLYEGENKYEKHSNGYTYRYNCVAKIIDQVSNNVFLVYIPWENTSVPETEQHINFRIELPDNIDIGYRTDIPGGLEYWIILENVAIDIYSSDSGIVLTPIVDSQSNVSVELSEEAALNWLNKSANN
ncbi:MAG: hypothetical protein IJE14_06555 [Clostridia bacterium]|nr:hypothetical protein [Clostridia bacterium]